MEVAKDRALVIEYSVKLEDGTIIKGENGPASLNFIVGYNQVMPALERRLLGLKKGEEVDFVIPAREAFGEYDPTQVHTRKLDEFPEGKNLEVGKWVVATNEKTEAQYSYFVKSKTEDSITLDFNHPLAGKSLHYHLRIVSVRQATREELQHLRPCETEHAADG